MLYFHPYYIQERPVRSIIIINIIVIVVVFIMLLLLFSIVIESLLFPCPQYLCVVWLVSITQQKKVGTVGCTHRLALSKQIKIIFLVTATLFLPPLPPPHLSILKLWSNFILGLNFIFFSFKLSIIITIPKNLPTLAGTNLGCSGDSPQLSTAPITPLPVGEIYEVNKILALLCAAH